MGRRSNYWKRPMAERPSVKDILAAARRGGPAKPADEGAAESVPVEEAVAAAEPEAPPVPAPVAATAAAPFGRPLTLKEKLAAARAGAAAPAPAASAAAAPAPVAETPVEAAAVQESPAAPAVPIAPPSLGRPLSLKEKLAAAKAGGVAPASAGAKPAAAPAKAPAATGAAVAAAKPAVKDRVLPPLDKITDPKDLAEALRRAGAAKEKESKAAAAAAAPPKPAATPKKAEVKVVPPKPGKEAAAQAAADAQAERRGFLIGSIFVSWIVVGWSTFTAALSAATLMCARFMYPNVLAEPPSTVKVGLPSNFENDEVSERWKAEWGFWIVRHDGQIYALQSVCTHLGCPPNWLAGEQKFKCPCHGSGFYITGINFEGPAPRPLERFKVMVADDGQIVVDKSLRFQQEQGQWSDADSFIPV
jgi:cytochrome b6-f complex iron-sulfur subunit